MRGQIARVRKKTLFIRAAPKNSALRSDANTWSCPSALCRRPRRLCGGSVKTVLSATRKLRIALGGRYVANPGAVIMVNRAARTRLRGPDVSSHAPKCARAAAARSPARPAGRWLARRAAPPRRARPRRRAAQRASFMESHNMPAGRRTPRCGTDAKGFPSPVRARREVWQSGHFTAGASLPGHPTCTAGSCTACGACLLV